MSIISTFNKALSGAINKENEDYTAIIGTEGFVPEPTIVDSADFNCGALCNELEYLRTVSEYYVQSFDLDFVNTENLEALMNAFIDIPRRNRGEPDDIYRKRFRTIVVQKINKRRTTKWAIIDALSHIIQDSVERVQVIEPWDMGSYYFQLRIDGAQSFDDIIFLNNVNQSYLNQNFLAGPGIGAVISYLGEIVDRIKAAGVDYDIMFISQERFVKTVSALIGSVQLYKTVGARIKRSEQIAKTIDATVV